MTGACHLKNDKVLTRLPIQCGLLKLILFEVQRLKTQDQPYLSLLYKTIFILGYYGLFRAGELTYGEHVIKAGNVHVAGNKEKTLVILYSSKMHNKGQAPQRIKITSHNADGRAIGYVHRFFCPFVLVCQFIRFWGNFHFNNDQFFIFNNGDPVKPSHARHILKSCLKRLGLSPECYNLHSFRCGRATDMQKFNYSLEEIRRAGRWKTKSNSVFRYLRQILKK